MCPWSCFSAVDFLSAAICQSTLSTISLMAFSSSVWTVWSTVCTGHERFCLMSSSICSESRGRRHDWCGCLVEMKRWQRWTWHIQEDRSLRHDDVHRLPVSLRDEHLACTRLPPNELISSPPDAPWCTEIKYPGCNRDVSKINKAKLLRERNRTQNCSTKKCIF